MTQALVRSPIACRAADALQIRNKTCLANSPILKGSFEFTYQLVTSYLFNSFYRTSLCNMFVTFCNFGILWEHVFKLFLEFAKAQDCIKDHGQQVPQHNLRHWPQQLHCNLGMSLRFLFDSLRTWTRYAMKSF